MKRRVGFVSNSSSSSFILMGAEIDCKALTNKKKAEILNSHEIEIGEDEDDTNDIFYDAMYGGTFNIDNPGDTDFFGILLSMSDECGCFLNDKALSLEEYIKLKKDAEDAIFEFLGQRTEAKLIIGTCST